MNSEAGVDRVPEPGSAGFTLVEVLVAMLILAVGLLGLEALGIGAARSIARAERQSGYATIASDSLESALHQLRLVAEAVPGATVPSNFCQTDLRFGDRLSRLVDLTNLPLARVTVRVIPNLDSGTPPATSFEISSAIYLPGALFGAPAGQSCA